MSHLYSTSTITKIWIRVPQKRVISPLKINILIGMVPLVVNVIYVFQFQFSIWKYLGVIRLFSEKNGLKSYFISYYQYLFTVMTVNKFRSIMIGSTICIYFSEAYKFSIACMCKSRVYMQGNINIYVLPDLT